MEVFDVPIFEMFCWNEKDKKSKGNEFENF